MHLQAVQHESARLNCWQSPTKKKARILPVWGEFLKREEKGEEKKELDRGLHIFSSIACPASSHMEGTVFSGGSTRKARKLTQRQQETGTFSEGNDDVAPKRSSNCGSLYNTCTCFVLCFHIMSIFMYLVDC